MTGREQNREEDSNREDRERTWMGQREYGHRTGRL
jgi:hypothetical protein